MSIVGQSTLPEPYLIDHSSKVSVVGAKVHLLTQPDINFDPWHCHGYSSYRFGHAPEMTNRAVPWMG